MAILETDVSEDLSAAIAIFVKTPGLSPIKTRLAKNTGEEKALEFYNLSVRAVEATVKNINTQGFWAVAEEEGVDQWPSFEALWTDDGGLGERQHHIYQTLLEKHEKVILIGADAPQISPEILNEAIVALDKHDFVIGPAHDGGYYLFGGRIPVDKDIWISVEWSAEITREEFENALPSKPLHLLFLTDVDEVDDLKKTVQEMPENPSEQQRQLIDWVVVNATGAAA